jgi:surface antigen/pimeloyl-ACP methyl ester carboxylesterase
MGVAVDSAGNLFVADMGNCTLRKVSPAGVVTTLAGSAWYFGSVDGTGSAARFEEPSGVAVDSRGNVFVADQGNYTIRKVTPAGVVTTLAGSAGNQGSADGTGSAARFRGLSGVAVDSAGNVFVADTGNDTIRKVTPAGVVTTLAGSAWNGGSADGTGSAARFYEPYGVAVDSAGNVFVADTGNQTIRQVTPAGMVTTLAGSVGNSGSADGTGSAARFYCPYGVAVDSAGNVFVADTGNDTIRKVTLAGAVTTLAGSAGSYGSADGVGSAARFGTYDAPGQGLHGPWGLAADSAGNVFVADYGNCTIRKVTPAGLVTTIGGTAGVMSGADGIGTSAIFAKPTGIAVDSMGNLDVADYQNNAIRKGWPTSGGVRVTIRVKATTGSISGTINIRDALLADPPLGQQYSGVHGTVTDGPVFGTAGGFAGNWWKVHWDAGNWIGGPDGWSADSYISAVPTAGDVAQPNFSTSHYTSANIFWQSGNAPASTSPPNPQLGSALGNCTWYAHGRMRELGYSSTQLNALSGNAGPWANQAVASGIAVDTTPAVGSIAQSVSQNHVAVVESVNSDGTITVTESAYVNNNPPPGSVWNFLWRHRTVSPSWFQNFIHVSIAPPTIASQPTSQTAQAGANVTFSVVATGTPPMSYQWLFNGANIPGATSSTLTLNSVGAVDSGAYSVVVWNSHGSATSAAAQLILMQQTSRQATATEIGQSTIDPNSQLQVYTSGEFKSNVPLDPNRMTIVLTHGWNSSYTDWPAAMAPLFALGSRTPTPNIVAWDWEKDAASDLPHISWPVSKIPAQGDLLGKGLLAQLGPNYSQPIHFIGHSLGALVNARAADYLHGDGPRPPTKGVNAFQPANTQMTLFDEAELAPEFMNHDLSSLWGMIFGLPVPVDLFCGNAMPKRSRWADNYVSAIGLLYSNAANVILTKNLPGYEPDILAWTAAITAFHSYPYGWYDLTVPVCSAALMGDQWSFEQSGFSSAPATNSVFLQTADVSPMDLVQTDMQSGSRLLYLRYGKEAASLGIAAGGSLVDGEVQVEGQVLGEVGSVLLPGATTLYMLLQTVRGGGLLHPNGLPANSPNDDSGGGGTNAPAFAWIPLAVPSNAVSMSFDFMLQGDGQDDSFAVALGGTNVLSLAMSLIQTNVTLSSGLIDVSQWAGQTVELFLGIVGGTSTNASLTAGGISFYAVVPPSLQAQAYGNNLVITWPLSAGGYALETSSSLTGTYSWASVTNVPVIVDSQYTITNAISGGSRFYRLRNGQ